MALTKALFNLEWVAKVKFSTNRVMSVENPYTGTPIAPDMDNITILGLSSRLPTALSNYNITGVFLKATSTSSTGTLNFKRENFYKGVVDVNDYILYNQSGSGAYYQEISFDAGANKKELDTSEPFNGLVYAGTPSSAGVYLSNISIELEGVFRPTSPRLIHPIGGVVVDATTNTLLGVNVDNFFGSSETEVNYRLIGSSTWISETRLYNTNESSFIISIPPNTLVAGEYEWRARSKWNIDTEWSSWSYTETFKIAAQTNVPTITSPTQGEVIATSNLVVDFVAVPYQEKVKLKVKTSGKDDQEFEYTTSNNHIEKTNVLENNKDYIIGVAIKKVGELWSDFAEVNISVSYTPPAIPTISTETNLNTLSKTITLIKKTPTGTEPTVTRQELFALNNGEYIKIANLLPTDSYTDYAIASGESKNYRVIVYGDNDTTNSLDFAVSMDEFKDNIIHLASNPLELVKLAWQPSKSFSTNFDANKMVFAGRQKPVFEFGEITETNGSLQFEVLKNDLAKLQSMVSKKEALLFKDSRGRKLYGIIGAIEVTDYVVLNDHYIISFDFTETDYQEGIE